MWKPARIFLRTHLRAMRILATVSTVCLVSAIAYIGCLVGHGHFTGAAPIRTAWSGETLSSFGAVVFLGLVFGGMAGFGILVWALMLHFIRRRIETAEELDERDQD
jgi:short subunit fatty acids transporter